MDENTRLAEKNLTREPELAEQRNIINDLSAQGKDLCARIQEMLAESSENRKSNGSSSPFRVRQHNRRLSSFAESKTSKISQDTAHALLQTAAAESEEQSEQIVKQLMDKELPIEQFLEQFLSARRTMHLRKVKADKMDELARQLRQSAALGGGGGGGARPYSGFYPASTPNAATTPYPPAMGGAHNSAVPYPRGPIMHMPMPGQYPPYPRP